MFEAIDEFFIQSLARMFDSIILINQFRGDLIRLMNYSKLLDSRAQPLLLTQLFCLIT